MQGEIYMSVIILISIYYPRGDPITPISLYVIYQACRQQKLIRELILKDPMSYKHTYQIGTAGLLLIASLFQPYNFRRRYIDMALVYRPILVSNTAPMCSQGGADDT